MAIESTALTISTASSATERLLANLDRTIENLGAQVSTEVKEDLKLAKKAKETLDSVVADFRAGAEVITRENQELAVRFGLGKKAPIFTRLKTQSLEVLNRIPGANNLTSRLGFKTTASFKDALMRQYQLTSELTEQLRVMIESDREGLGPRCTRLGEEIVQYLADVQEIDQKGKDILMEIAEKENTLYDIAQFFKTRYSCYNLTDLDITALDPEGIDKCKLVQTLENDIFGLKTTETKLKSRRDTLLNFIVGKKAVLGVMSAYHAKAQEIYEGVSNFLKESEGDFDALSGISHLEETATGVAAAASVLRNNFNQTLKTSARHYSLLEDCGDHLTPNSLYDLQTVVETVTHIRDGVKKAAMRDPEGTLLRLGTAVDALDTSNASLRLVHNSSEVNAGKKYEIE